MICLLKKLAGEGETLSALVQNVATVPALFLFFGAAHLSTASEGKSVTRFAT